MRFRPILIMENNLEHPEKYRAVAKIVVDAMFSPLIKKYADHIVIIRSNSKIRLHHKMVEINNGVNTEKSSQKRTMIQKMACSEWLQ